MDIYLDMIKNGIKFLDIYGQDGKFNEMDRVSYKEGNDFIWIIFIFEFLF